MTAITRCEQCSEWTQGFHCCLDATTPLNLSQPIEGVTAPKTVTKRTGVADHARNAEIVRLYAAGESATYIAGLYNLDPTTIRFIGRNAGIRRPNGVAKTVRPPELIAQMAALYANEWSLAAIGKEVHVNQGEVARLLRAHGVTIRPARNVKRVAS